MSVRLPADVIVIRDHPGEAESRSSPDNNNNGVFMSVSAGGRTRSLHGSLLALLLCLLPLNVQAERLEQPAQPGMRAMQALLLDIAQVGERLVTAGEQGIVLTSDNRGESWQPAQVPVSVMLTALHFPTDKLGWAVGHDGVVLSTEDGGLSWQRRLTGNDINTLRHLQLTQLLADLPDSVSDDQRETLEYALDDAAAAIDDGPTTPLLDVWFADANTGYLLGGYGLLLKTTDGGNSWRSIGHQTENPDNFHLNSLVQSANGDLLIAGEAGLLLRANSDGEQWQALDSPYEGSFFALTRADQLYVMGLRGHLFRSGTGEHWQPVELSERGSLNGAISSDSQLWLVGQGGTLLQRTPTGFTRLETPSRRSFSAGVKSGNWLVLAGEGGITRIAAHGEEAEQ